MGHSTQMKPIFLSYRRTSRAEVEILADTLRLRGVRVFLDVSDPDQISGPAFADELRRIIRKESAALLIYVAGDIAGSAAIWNVEIPVALNRADVDTEFFVVSFFRDMEPAALSSVDPHGRRLAACNGIIAVPPSGTDPKPFLDEKYAEAAMLILSRLVRGKTGIINLSLQTRAIGPEAANSDLLLDWRSAYPGDIASAEGCAQVLQALRDLSVVLGKIGVRRLEIVPKAHLSAAIAFGAVFNRATGFQLEVQQGPSVWASSGHGPDHSCLVVVQQQLNPSLPDILLVIGISRPEIIGSAENACARLGIAYGGRIMITPRGGSSREAVESDSAARGMAEQIADALINARATWGKGTAHMFISAPVGLAVLTGHELNALGPIVVYEYDKDGNDYSKAFVI